MLSKKPLSWFKSDPNQPRKQFDEGDLRSLGETMLAVGQLQPVGAKPDGTLIWGERRLRAARLVGLQELTVVVTDRVMPDSELRIIQLVENMHREDLSPLEQVQAIEEYARLNPHLQNKEIAANLHIDASMVTRFRAVATSPIVLAALGDGTLKGISDAYAVAKAPVEQQERLLQLRLSGVSRDALEAIARNGASTHKVGPHSTDRIRAIRAKRVSIPLPKLHAAVTVTGEAASLDGLIAVLTDALEAARKAHRENISLATAQRGWADKARAGGNRAKRPDAAI